MQNEVVFAGFGGQGVLLIGKLLAIAGMNEGREVAWIPSYGPEMRGGTANCTVVVSDKPISSPIIRNPQNAVVLNRPSFDKFEPAMKSNGILIVNSSLIDISTDRSDINVFSVKANEIANKLGNSRAANMVILGAFIGKSKVVNIKSIKNIVKSEFEKKKPQFVESNIKAIEEGYQLAIS